MGTDIHVDVQQFDEKKGVWKSLKLYVKKENESGEEVLEPSNYFLEYRNYELFDKLAGARTCFSDSDSLVPPRGYPRDYDGELTEDAEWLHSKTWYDYIELKALARTPEAYVTKYNFDEEDEEGNPVEEKVNVVQPWVDNIDILLDMYFVYPQQPGDVRIVIAFDS